MYKKYMKVSIILTIIISMVLISCKSKTSETKSTEQSTDGEIKGKVEVDNQEQAETDNKYSDYMLFTHKDEKYLLNLYLLNKKTKECKVIDDQDVKLLNTNIKEMEKENYFISDNNLYLLDGDTFDISLIEHFDSDENTRYTIRYAGNNLFIGNEGIYIQNLDSKDKKLLIEDFDLNKVVYRDNIVYIKVYDRGNDNGYVYKYDIGTEELNKVYDIDNEYKSNIEISENKDLYILEETGLSKYDFDENKIIKLKEQPYNKQNESDNRILVKFSEDPTVSLYSISNDNYMKVTDFKSVEDIMINDYIYILTVENNVIKLDKNSLDVIEILNWNESAINKLSDRTENSLRLEDDKMYEGNYSMIKSSEDSYFLDGTQKNDADYKNPYIVKDNRTYLESDINRIKEKIEEEYTEFTFSNKVIAYIRKADNHLVIMDMKNNKEIYTSDYPVSYIKAHDGEVYYTRYDDELGFYCYADGKNNLIDKTIVSDYNVTDDNIYYNTAYNSVLKCMNKSTKDIKTIDEHIDIMTDDSDVLYYIKDKLIYKVKDGQKDFIDNAPLGWLTIFFYHDNNLYIGSAGAACTEIYKVDTEYNKPNNIMYEDEDTIIYPVTLSAYEESSDAIYIYDKKEKDIKDVIYKFYKSNCNAVTDDAFYISNNNSIIYKIDLKSLSVEEFYKYNHEYEPLSDPLDFYVLNKRYCVIGNNNDIEQEDGKHTGITIIDLEKPENETLIESGKLLYAMGNYVYYQEQDESLVAMDFSNGINTDKISTGAFATSYRATYDNYIIFKDNNDLFMLDNRDNTTKSICNDITHSNYEDIIAVSADDVTDISVIYVDIDNNIVKVDNDKKIIAENVSNHVCKNNIIAFTKAKEDRIKIKDTIYLYDIEKDKLSDIKLDVDSNIDYISFYIEDNKLVIRIINNDGGVRSEEYNIPL